MGDTSLDEILAGFAEAQDVVLNLLYRKMPVEIKLQQKSGDSAPNGQAGAAAFV